MCSLGGKYVTEWELVSRTKRELLAFLALVARWGSLHLGKMSDAVVARNGGKGVESAMIALLVAVAFMFAEGVFLTGMGYRSSNPAALLSLLTLRSVGHWFVLIYPVALVVLYVWFAVIVARRLPDLLVHPNAFAQAGTGPRISFALLTVFAVYISFPTSYALYAWLYNSCQPLESWNGIGISFQCEVLPEYPQYSSLAIEQFIRGLLGDFVEIIDASDPLHGWDKDPLFTSVTALYRIFAQTALLVIPLAIWNTARLLIVRR